MKESIEKETLPGEDGPHSPSTIILEELCLQSSTPRSRILLDHHSYCTSNPIVLPIPLPFLPIPTPILYGVSRATYSHPSVRRNNAKPHPVMSTPAGHPTNPTNPSTPSAVLQIVPSTRQRSPCATQSTTVTPAV